MEKKRGRVALVDNKQTKVETLKLIEAGDQDFSWYMKQKLLSTGLVEYKTQEKDGVRRGRPAKLLVLTGKGRGYLALAKNWFKKAEIESTLESIKESIETEVVIAELEEMGA